MTAPPDKEGRKLDAIGKRFSSMSALSIRAANSLALLGRYNRQIWADIAPYLGAIPEDQKDEVKKILLEGERSASEMIEVALDIASTGFRQLAGAAVLRRQGWLKATAFRPEVQAKVLDMPFDGERLFGEHIDDMLQGIKKDTETAKALGTLQFKQNSFRGSRGRGQQSRGNYQGYKSSYNSSQQYKPQYQQRQQQQGQSSYNKSSFRGRGGKKDNNRRQ